MRFRRLWHALTALALLLLVISAAGLPTAFAFDIRGGEDQLTIREVIDDDLYAAAETLVIDGTVRGDAVLAGRTVIVNGTIEGNLMAAGQTIIVNGTVRDSARLAGQAVQIGSHARIGRDLMVAAYSLEARTESAVSRDLGIGAYQALLAGSIARNLRGRLGALDIQGQIGGNVDVDLGQSSDQPAQAYTSPPPAIAMPIVRPGLTIGETARINGTLAYRSREQFPVPGQVLGGVTFTERPAQETATGGVGGFLADQFRRLAALTLVGLLLMWLVPGWTRRLVDTAQQRPLPAFGWGLVAAMSLMATAIGIGLATGVVAAALGGSTLFGLMALTIVVGLLGETTLITATIAFTALVAQAMASYLGGQWLLQRIQPQWVSHRIIPLLVGLVLFVAITTIPVLGGVIGFAVAVFGLGALWLWVEELRRPRPAAAAPTAELTTMPQAA